MKPPDQSDQSEQPSIRLPYLDEMDDALRQILDEFEATNGRMYQNSQRPDQKGQTSTLPPMRPKYYGRQPSNNLRDRRNMRRLTQTELAAKTGTTRRTIVSIENSRHEPSVYLALAISQALGMKVEDIFHLPPLTPVPPSRY